MTQMESPKRKMQKKNDYQRHKLFRKIKRRRKAQAEAEQHIAEKQLRKKLKLPKFGDGKSIKSDTGAPLEAKDGMLYYKETGQPFYSAGLLLPEVEVVGDKSKVNPWAAAGRHNAYSYFDGNWSKDLINATPGIGDAMDVSQVIDDTSKGKYLSAGAGAFMLALPNFIEKPVKYLGKKSLPLLFKYYNKTNLPNQLQRVFKNLESNGNLMPVEDILKEYSSSGHFRMPTNQEDLDRYTKISPLQLFMARQTSAGRQFNPKIVYHRTPEYYDYMYNRHLFSDWNSSGSFAYVGNSRTMDPYDAVIDKSQYKRKVDMEQAISHELAHSLQHKDNIDASDLALKAFGYTPISNKYFMDGADIEFGARGSQLKNYLGIYGNIKPGLITFDDYGYAVSHYPYKFRNNNIDEMRDYTSDSNAAAKFIQDYSFNSGKDIHIKPSKRGTFTKAAKAHGMSVQGFANKVLKNPSNYSAAMRKKANFARNAAKWNR